MSAILTKEGYEKLRKDLDYLKNIRRKELSKEIGEARRQGDLRENSAYHEAKNEQGRIEAKIKQLEAILQSATILDTKNTSFDKIVIGAKAKIKDLTNNSELLYTFVSPQEVDYENGKISFASPVGRQLASKKVGDKVEIKTPLKIIKYEILEII